MEHEGVDLGLRDAGLAAALAYGDDLGCWAGEGEDLVGDEVVGKDDVGGLEEGLSAEGEETGISWTCADEVDDSWLSFGITQVVFSGMGFGSGFLRACSRAKVRDGHRS